MGMIRRITYTVNHLELTLEDIEKQRQRRERRNTFPKPTPDIVAFCKRLNPCPICGEYPHPLIVGEPGDYSVKMSCSGDAFHFDQGDWKKGFARAGKLWNQHTRDADLVARERKKDEHFKKLWEEKHGKQDED